MLPRTMRTWLSRLLDDDKTRPAATRIIARVAGPADFDLLVELADRVYRDERNLVLEALRRVAAADREAAQPFSNQSRATYFVSDSM